MSTVAAVIGASWRAMVVLLGGVSVHKAPMRVYQPHVCNTLQFQAKPASWCQHVCDTGDAQVVHVLQQPGSSGVHRLLCQHTEKQKSLHNMQPRKHLRQCIEALQ